MNKPVKCGCGGEAKVIHWDTNTPQEQYDVYCDGCGISTEFYPTEAKAVEAWNRAMGGKMAKVENYQDPFGLGGYGDCSEWGAEVNEQYAYCPNCGARLEWYE